MSLFPIPLSSDNASAPCGYVLSPYALGDSGPRADEGGEGFALSLSGGFESDSIVAVEVRPDSVRIVNAAGSVDGALELSGKPLNPWVLLGTPDASRLELGSLLAGLHLTGTVNDPELTLTIGSLEQSGGFRLILDTSSADRFLQTLLGTEPRTLEFGLGLRWSSKSGFAFAGATGFSVDLPLHTTLGPIEIRGVKLKFSGSNGKSSLAVGLTASAKIGPLTVAVEDMGMTLLLEPVPSGTLGTFGDLDVGFGFKAPTGLGILVDAGPVVGGGFLSFDEPNGRYTGILQLQICSIATTAIGLLDTRLPGGQSGYSFLIIITAKFPPIQLGYGVTLNGAGGLAGIHRTVIVNALQAGVRAGSIDYILFPEDPIRDAAIIISDLRAFFPPAHGRFLFGPIALLGWGTPSLITAELGIIIELPLPIRLLLLGQLAATIPAPDAAIVELHLDILGVLDFEAKMLSIDATLRDSRIAAFTLSGDMAMRLNWGDKPNFALAVGGWNPHFQPPPAFPTLARVTVALGTGDNPRINLQGYLALTTNTVQLGALAELYAEKSGFNVKGWIGFDALFIFTPFSFRTDFSAGVAFRRGGSVLASVHLDATLTGPSPFHAWGEASISILFLDASVPFDAEFGPTTQIDAPSRDPWELLEPAVRDLRNWSTELPPGTQSVVALRKPSPDSTMVVFDPAGMPTFRQRTVPLNFPVEKLGEATVIGAGRYDLTSVAIDGDTLPAADRPSVQDMFARGQFCRMSDQEKLSIPSFEPLDSGVRINDQSVTRGEPLGRDVEYETVLIDSKWTSRRLGRHSLQRAQQMAMLGASAKARSTIENSGSARFGPAPGPRQFQFEDEKYVVVSKEDLASQPAILEMPTTQGRARDALRAHLARHPDDQGKYQVVPIHEAA